MSVNGWFIPQSIQNYYKNISLKETKNPKPKLYNLNFRLLMYWRFSLWTTLLLSPIFVLFFNEAIVKSLTDEDQQKQNETLKPHCL